MSGGSDITAGIVAPNTSKTVLRPLATRGLFDFHHTARQPGPDLDARRALLAGRSTEQAERATCACGRLYREELNGFGCVAFVCDCGRVEPITRRADPDPEPRCAVDGCGRRATRDTRRNVVLCGEHKRAGRAA